MPTLQFSLVSIYELVHEGILSIEQLVQKCVMHRPSFTRLAKEDLSDRAIRPTWFC